LLDNKRLGIRLASLRKEVGYTQEKLAELLCLSPQAISKWENGHSIPETSLLPVLAQILSCTIDEMIMPAYAFDEKIEREKSGAMERQAEQIANRVMEKLEDKMTKYRIGLDVDTIIAAVHSVHPNIGNCEIHRGKENKTNRYISIGLTISAPQHEIHLLEKIYRKDDSELHHYNWLRGYTSTIPQIYHIDEGNHAILMEDLSAQYAHGFNFNEDNDDGVIIRENLPLLIRAAAQFHGCFWENSSVFERVGLDWRLESRENLLAHISGMEKDFLKYRVAEASGKVPKVWHNTFHNNIDTGKLDYFQTAITLLRERYVELIDTRFNAGKNITVIHGDLHPGNTFISRSADKTVKFIDMQAVRMGLPTEDLAMLLALHIEPDKKRAMSLLDQYYACLCESVTDYPYETFLRDYEISIMESMFFSIRLFNQRKIYDFSMRDRAIRAFETFVLGTE